MTEKKCGHHEKKWKKKLRRAAACFLVFSFVILLIVLLVWAILQPKKPRFIVQDVTVFNFNVSSPNLLSSNMQITVNSRNPNDKIGIYYDKLDVYAVYRSQQITYYAMIQPVYQGHKDVNVWSPFIYGTDVPVAPYNGVALSQDQTNGGIWVLIKIDGRLRWKVGTIITGRYRLHVTCPVYIPFGNRNSGNVIGTAVKYQMASKCDVSV